MFQTITNFIKSYLAPVAAEPVAAEPVDEEQVAEPVVSEAPACKAYISKIPIFTHGKRAERILESLNGELDMRQVDHTDPTIGEIIRADWLHHWMSNEEYVETMIKNYLDLPYVKRQPNPLFVYIGADTNSLVATIFEETGEPEYYWEDDYCSKHTYTEEIGSGNITEAIERLWGKIITEQDFRNNIMYVMLYGYRFRDLAFDFGCPMVKETENFCNVWDENHKNLRFNEEDYEIMGFTPNVMCKETESVFNRSSIPGFNLVCDTYSPQGVPSKYNCTYKIPSINYPEKGDLAIYVDDESITLLQFPEADTIESYTFSDFHTIDPARIVFESIKDMNETYAKED